MYRFFADIVVIAHCIFIVFVVIGGVFVIHRPWLALIHLPSVIWGAAVEIFGWICPLTPLENYLRRLGGGNAYSGGFIEHYLLPLIYPAHLAISTQYVLAALVTFINLITYFFLIKKMNGNKAGKD